MSKLKKAFNDDGYKGYRYVVTLQFSGYVDATSLKDAKKVVKKQFFEDNKTEFWHDIEDHEITHLYEVVRGSKYE